MPRFFFHLHHCGELFEDEEGRDFPDTASAMRQAAHEARGFLAAEVASGQLCLGCHIEVVNTETGEKADVPFAETVSISGALPQQGEAGRNG